MCQPTACINTCLLLQAALDSATEGWVNNTSGSNSPYGGCSLPCDASLSFEAGCCEQLWLPHVDLPNLIAFDYQVIEPTGSAWRRTHHLLSRFESVNSQLGRDKLGQHCFHEMPQIQNELEHSNHNP